MNAKMLTALFLLLTTAGTLHAATTAEVAAGIADATPRENGIWYQKGFPYRMQRRVPALLIGLRTDVTEHVALHGGFYWFGSARTHAQAVGDAAYVAQAPNHCFGPCPPTSRYITRGSVYGARLLAEWHTGGAWDLGIMAGPIFYHTTWALDVPDWFSVDRTPGGYALGPVTPVRLRYGRWGYSKAAGLRLTHGHQFVELMVYEDGASLVPEFPPNWSRHVTLTYGFSF